MQQHRYYLKDKPWFHIPEKVDYPNKTATIIGGGLAGAAIAYFLSQANNNWDISIIERNGMLASQASGNLAGVFMPLISNLHDPLHQLSTRAFRFGVTHYQALETDVNLDLCGVVQITKQEKNPSNSEPDLRQFYNAKALSEIAGIELKDAGYFIKNGGWVSPKQLTEYYISQSNCLIRTKFHLEALSLTYSNEQWNILDKNQNSIAQSDIIILANAYDINCFKQSSFIPIRKIRGQNNYIPTNSRSSQLKTVISHDGILLPKIEEQHLIGATFIPDTTNCDLHNDETQENINQICTLLPHIFNKQTTYSNNGRAAIRAASADRIPFVGNLPILESNKAQYADIHNGNCFKAYPLGQYYKGLYISVGYGSRGITTIPYASYLLSKLINCNLDLSRHEEEALTLMNPMRFIIRNLKKNIK